MAGGERQPETQSDRTGATSPGVAAEVLTEIMHLVDMRAGVTGEGWSDETARLFALDTAMTSIKRDLVLLSESRRLTLVGRLQEAKALVVAGRDDELGFVQSALETHLSTARGQERSVWATAMDALLPDPYRAALVSTRNALTWNPQVSPDSVLKSIRERLIARLDEGALLSDPPPHLFLIA